MSIILRGQTWWADITHRGRRVRETLGTADKAEAQRAHDELKARLWHDQQPGRQHRLKEAANLWLAETERDIKDRYRLSALLEKIGDAMLDTINASLIAQTLSGQSPGNYNRNRALIVAILNLAHRHGWLADVPHLPTKRIATPRIRHLTADEWQRLHAALPDHLKPMARLAISTGLRRNNVTHMEWPEVDLARRVAWIHPDQAKSGKPIGVPLADDAVDVLRGQIGKHTRWVFPTHRGGPQNQISTGWKAALARAGIESSFRWHDLRHTWASWHVMGGTPLEVLQKLGGWASLSMVMRYAHLSPGHLAGYANNARPYSANNQPEQEAA